LTTGPLLPPNGDYTTLAGFFLNEFRRIPQKGDILIYKGHKFVVEEMLKRFIAQIRIEIRQTKN
jgi:putative hemolysin